jgi:hypothetical protein
MNMTLMHVIRLASCKIILNFSERIDILLGDLDCAYWAFTSWYTIAIKAFINVVIVEQGSKIDESFPLTSQGSIVREINGVRIEFSLAFIVNVDVFLKLGDPFNLELSSGTNEIQDAILEKELLIIELLSWSALPLRADESDLEELTYESVLLKDSVELILISYNAC